MSGPAGAEQPVAPDPTLGQSPAHAPATSLPAGLTEPDAGADTTAIGPVSDPATWAPTEPVEHACPWCSSVLPELEVDRCPACGANLVYGAAVDLPGVTEVAPAVNRGRNGEPAKRNRLLSWISGEIDDEPAPGPADDAPLEALAPPSRDVRREILRLRLIAEGIVVSPSGEIELPTGADVTTGQAADEPAPPADLEDPSAGIDDPTTPEGEVRKAS